MRQIEMAYAHDESADSIFALTEQLTKLAQADTASHLKKARAALFRARYCDRFSPYTEAWKSDAVDEIKNAYRAYGDTTSYPYDIFRLQYIERKLRPRKLEQRYFHNTQMLQLARQFGDSLTTAGTLNNIGLVYLNLGDSAVALSYFNQSLQRFHEMGLEQWEKKIQLSVAQVNTHLNPRLHDSIMNDLEAYATSRADTSFLTIILHNRYSNHGDIRYIIKALPLVEHKPGYTNQEAFYKGLIANDMLSIGKIDSAGILIRQAQQLISPTILPDYAATIHGIYASVLEREGKLDSALTYYHRSQTMKDSLQEAHAGQDILNLISKEKIRQSQEAALREKMIDRLFYVAITVVLIFLALAVISMLLRRHNNLKMEKMKSDLQLARNQLQLASSLAIVKENDNAIDTTIKTITHLMDEGRIPYADGASVCSALRAHLSNREELATFQQVYANVHPNFLSRLLEISPNLSENDKRLATYIAMGMDNRQIARVMRIEYKSVITARYRLRTRLHLKKEDSLEALMQHLSEE
ncbi:MAG: helix-turn-helix transcriptional regulator [Sodaliphilus sp.]